MSLAMDVDLMPTRVDLATWDAEIGRRDDAYELVEGVPTMVPEESVFNRTVGSTVTFALRDVPEAAVGTDVEVTISEVPATVRQPDVVLFDKGAFARRGGRLLSREVLFVAEVVSPTSVERDLVAKRHDYAAAGTPLYLIVDLRDGRQELTLYDLGDDGRYADVEPKEAVAFTIQGTEIELSAKALLP